MARTPPYAYACAAFFILTNLAYGDPVMGDPVGGKLDKAQELSSTLKPELNAVTQSPVALRVVGTEKLGQITGKNSPNDTASKWDIHGTDLGHMFWHEGGLYMVFGDTFGAKGVFGRNNWRSNTLARIADPNPRNGLPIETMITGPDGKAKELLASRKIDGVEMTVIPTQGISIDGKMYLHYMSVRHWGKPGHWDVRHSGIAYSVDSGQNWVVPVEAVEKRAIGFEQVAFVRQTDMLYTFGIPEGRFGGVKLRRVAPKNILARNAHEYWDGAKWVRDAMAAKTIIPGPVGELSVAWSEAHGCWLMMYGDPDKRAVVLRTARQLTGPWGEEQIVATREDYPGLYGPYIVPGSEIDGELYYTLSQWEPYNVFLMRSSLEREVIATASAPAASAPKVTTDSAQVVKQN